VFYVNTGWAFIFVSEIKTLFAHPEVQRQLDPHGVYQLFTFWVTLPPRTFKNVHELPPGHSLPVRDGEVSVEGYWELNYEPQPHAEDSKLMVVLWWSNQLAGLPSRACA
jgi:asparagine synthase (glutamine-hydrolysing)